MNTAVFNSEALCFFDEQITKKHNAFFSLLSDDKGIFNSKECYSLLSENIGTIFVYDSLTSTLDKAHELVMQGKFDYFSSVICREQISARGQLRRKWESMKDNLYIAMALPNVYPFNSDAAAPAFGAMVAYGLDKMGFSVELKWTNDLVQKTNNVYQKVGGILLEERNGMLIAGMGINLSSFPNDTCLRDDFFISAGALQGFSVEDVLQKYNKYFYTSLKTLKNNCDLNKCVCGDFSNYNNMFFVILGFWFALVKEIKLCYENQIISKAPDAWLNICKKYLAFVGDNVIVKQALTKNDEDREMFSDSVSGQILGLGREGELILSSREGLISIVGGSLTKV